MRKFKLFLPLIAVLIAVAGVFAMKANKVDQKNQVFAVQTWDYNGPVGLENDPNLYSLNTTGTPNHSTCGEAEETICQIEAEPQLSDPTKPELNGKDPMDPNEDFNATRRDAE